MSMHKPEWSDIGLTNTAEQFHVLKSPVYSWRVVLGYSTYIYVIEGKQPNWFHRKMQELILGFKWEKLK